MDKARKLADNNPGVVKPAISGEGPNKIHPDRLPRIAQDQHIVEQSGCLLVAGFAHLANSAAEAEFLTVLAHPGPPEPMVEIFRCLLGTQMAQDVMCVVNVDAREAMFV